MRKMRIEADCTLAQALELFPQALPFFMQLGLCCVSEDNENWTVEELCRNYMVEPESFIEALNAGLSGC